MLSRYFDLGQNHSHHFLDECSKVHFGVVCVQYWPLFALLTQFVFSTVFVYSSEILATAAHFIAAAIVICGGSVVVWHVQGMHFLSYYACRKYYY